MLRVLHSCALTRLAAVHRPHTSSRYASRISFFFLRHCWVSCRSDGSHCSLTICVMSFLMRFSHAQDNTVTPVLSVPAVTAEPLLAQISSTAGPPVNSGCAPLENADEMAGKFCLTYRGSCLFQTKYANCLAAGAVGAAVINQENTFTVRCVCHLCSPSLFGGTLLLCQHLSRLLWLSKGTDNSFPSVVWRR